MDLNKLVASFKQKLSKPGSKDNPSSEDDDQKTAKKNKKPLIDFGDEYLWTSCFALAVIASLLFAYLLKDNFFERRALSHLEEQSERLAAQIKQSTDDIRGRAAAVIAHNPDADDIVSLIEANVEGTLRVVKISEPVDQIEPTTEFPGINFATLDMIKKTSESQQEPQPEIHLYGHRNQYLNFVYIQKPEETYVVVSYPVEMIIKPQKMEFDRSELALVQKSGAYSSVVLQKWGQVDPSVSRNNQEIPIANSPFFVTYAVEKKLQRPV